MQGSELNKRKCAVALGKRAGPDQEGADALVGLFGVRDFSVGVTLSGGERTPDTSPRPPRVQGI